MKEIYLAISLFCFRESEGWTENVSLTEDQRSGWMFTEREGYECSLEAKLIEFAPGSKGSDYVKWSRYVSGLECDRILVQFDERRFRYRCIK